MPAPKRKRPRRPLSAAALEQLARLASRPLGAPIAVPTIASTLRERGLVRRAEIGTMGQRYYEITEEGRAALAGSAS